MEKCSSNIACDMSLYCIDEKCKCLDGSTFISEDLTNGNKWGKCLENGGK